MTQPRSPLTERLRFLAGLDPDSCRAVDDMHGPRRSFRTGQTLPDDFRAHGTILVEGAVACSRRLRDGRRQILQLFLPGDFVAAPDLGGSDNGCELEVVSDAVVASAGELADRLADGALSEKVSSALAVALRFDEALRWNAVDRLTRQSGYERIAHFLLDLGVVAHASGVASDEAFDCPITLAILSDTLGLSVVQSSRIVTQLKQDDLAFKNRKSVLLPDRARLAQRVHYVAPPAYVDALARRSAEPVRRPDDAFAGVRSRRAPVVGQRLILA